MSDWRQGNQFDNAALKYGFKNRLQVIDTQLRMIDAKILKGRADGNWGNNSRRAYEEYKRRGYNKYGRINNSTNRTANSHSNVNWNDDSGLLANGLKYAAHNMGINNGIVDAALDLGSMGGYFIPGVGSALSAYDAYNSFRKGNYVNGIANLAFMIPGLAALKGISKMGRFGRGIQLANNAMGWKTNLGLIGGSMAESFARG